jgi:multiple sugar transport system permease protein
MLVLRQGSPTTLDGRVGAADPAHDGPAGDAGPRRAAAQSRRGRRRDAGLAYLLLAPSAVLIATFGFFPLLYAFLLSLRGPGTLPGGFVGLSNYATILGRDSDFWHSLGVSVFFVLGTVPATLVTAYLLAELLHRPLRGRGFYRSLFFMPYIVSPVAAAAIWRWIYDRDYGLANAALLKFGWQRLAWLNEPTGVLELTGRALGWHVPPWAAGPSLALVCIIVVSIWHMVGFAVVVLLAGLSGVPGDVVEAARIDGATGWPLMRHVKIPLLSPTLFFLLVVFTIRAFQTFSQLYVLSPDNRGGPAGSTRNVTLYIFLAFREFSSLGPSYGSAIAFLLFAIILALTLIQFRLVGRRVHYQ